MSASLFDSQLGLVLQVTKLFWAKVKTHTLFSARFLSAATKGTENPPALSLSLSRNFQH